jgi:hypothetical protein
MLTTETIQILLDEARYLDTKPPERHYMGTWLCGSTSCAVGDLMVRCIVPSTGSIYIDRFSVSPSNGWKGVCDALSLSIHSAGFLFSSELRLGRNSKWRNRSRETPAQTAARIRKFLYYKMRKAEIFADYERARHQEGDWGVAQHVLSELEVAHA